MSIFVVAVDPGETCGYAYFLAVPVGSGEKVVGRSGYVMGRWKVLDWHAGQDGPVAFDNEELGYHLQAARVIGNGVGWLRGLVGGAGVDGVAERILLMEDFILFTSPGRGRNSQRAGLSACRGGSAFCHVVRSLVPGWKVVRQQPSQVKGAIKGVHGVGTAVSVVPGYDVDHEMWVVGQQHARDAVRHGLVYFRR